jgi:ubiquinone/menaquinone biosynthesis C-methylase UbiE
MTPHQVDVYERLNHDQAVIKQVVREHWEAEPCELRYGRSESRQRFFEEIDAERYRMNPFIHDFAKFEEGRRKRVLEVGLGSASDFMRWARNGAILSGRDLTEAAVVLTKERLAIERLTADVAVGDVESMEFADGTFDLVYSYGTIHHTPDTPRAVRELLRVTKRGGHVRVMIYNARGLTFFYEWAILCFTKREFIPSIREAVFNYNESLGTKLYTVEEAQKMFDGFSSVNIRTIIGSGDVLDFSLSQRYQRVALIRNLKRMLSPIKYLRPLLPPALGEFMLIEATK